LFWHFPWIGLVSEMAIAGRWEVNWSRKAKFLDYMNKGVSRKQREHACAERVNKGERKRGPYPKYQDEDRNSCERSQRVGKKYIDLFHTSQQTWRAVLRRQWHNSIGRGHDDKDLRSRGTWRPNERHMPPTDQPLNNPAISPMSPTKHKNKDEGNRSTQNGGGGRMDLRTLPEKAPPP